MPASSSSDLLIAQIGGHVTNPCKRSLKTPKKVTGKKLVENMYLHFPLNVAAFSTLMYFHVLECVWYIGTIFNNCCRFKYSQVGPLEVPSYQNLNKIAFLAWTSFSGETTRRFLPIGWLFANYNLVHLSGGFIFLFWYSHLQIWV